MTRAPAGQDVDPLRSTHLMTLVLQVDFAGMLNVGPTPAGRRRIAPLLGGTFEGPRVRGVVLPGGADWVINRADGAMAIDVRTTLSADDGAIIYCTYQGLFRAEAEAMARFAKGELLAEREYSLRTHFRFECGAPAHAWLNDVLAVATGRQTASGPIYTVYEIL